MTSLKSHEYDCTLRCCLREHANEITKALTKRSLSDEKLAAFIAKTCCNFCNNLDDLGRSAVHLAASVDRYAILEWLLNHGALVNNGDFESGSTPLHRAIYYGCIDCAVLLLKYGASLQMLDNDTLCPLQNVCRACDFCESIQVPINNEILVWGSNKNYNLGIGSGEDAKLPQTIDYFRKNHISIQRVSLGIFHSLFLDTKSQLYVVGHGKGGSLGMGKEISLTTPKKIKIPFKTLGECITNISVSRDHSLLITNYSVVYACGRNDYKQLGVRDAGEYLATFKKVTTLQDLKVTGLLCVIAKDTFSLTYSEECVYFWGANYGQFGQVENSNKIVALPTKMKLPFTMSIKFVEANNCASVVYANKNSVYLCYNHKVRTLKVPQFEELKSISISGGDVKGGTKGTICALKLLLLTQTNVIFLWYEKTQNFYSCIFPHMRVTQIDKIFYKSNQVVLLSRGDVYKGKCIQVSQPTFVNNDYETTKKRNNLWSSGTSLGAEICKDQVIRIELERVPIVDRVVDIECDDELTCFAAIQESSYKYFKIPKPLPTQATFKKLLTEANEFDTVHDVVFHVDGDIFVCHKYLIYLRAPGLREIINNNPNTNDKNIQITDECLTGKMFDVMLKFIYTNYIPTELDLEEIQQSLGPHNTDALTLFEANKIFLRFVEEFHINELAKYLNSCFNNGEYDHNRTMPKLNFPRLRRNSLPDLYDVNIICGDNTELKAHKCILVSRMEYFEMMFSHTWAEKNTINLTTVPVEYMEQILDFIYSYDVDAFRRQNLSETYLYNMIVYCDQFFIENLRIVCETLILEKISIRKCGEMLNIAHVYNCSVLKSGCLDFICQNLARVLASKSLEYCEPDAIKSINEHYRKLFKVIFDYRMITPDADAIDEELLNSFVDDFVVDLNYRVDEDDDFLQKINKKNKTKAITINNGNSLMRQHERNAVRAMMETIKIEDNLRTTMITTPESYDDNIKKIIQDSAEISDKLQMMSKSWTKIIDKKEPKKQRTISESSNTSNHNLNIGGTSNTPTLRKQSESATTITPQSSSTTPKASPTTPLSSTAPVDNRLLRFISTNESPTMTTISSSPTSYNLDLSHLTPMRDKLSQKQRKLLNLTTGSNPGNNNNSSSTNISLTTSATSPSPPQRNAWNLLPEVQLPERETPTGSAVNDATSFANMMGSKGGSASGAIAKENSFTKILLEEQKQRDYYEKMRTKPFELTQIEDAAIDDLYKFYNVTNVADEVITIERKPKPMTVNFSVWQRHN